MATDTTRALAQRTAQANKELQYALKVYTERMEAEVQTVNKLLSIAEIDENEAQVETSGSVIVPGSKRPAGLLSSTELMSESSPFYEDSMRRERYLNLTETHPMKAKELDSLAESVRRENYRLCAYEAQRRGLQPFHAAHENPQQLELNTDGLDWERIAMNVSANSGSSEGRSAKECEIRWLGDRHPRFNHSAWTDPEIEHVKTLVEGIPEGEVDWELVAHKLGTNRTPIDCMRHAIHRKVHVWDDRSDARLLEAVKIYGTENWSLVARTVSEDATAVQCSNRYYRSLDPSLKRGSWSPEEDKRLRMAVDLYGHAWVDVASVVPGRTNEQCRDRWSDRLNPRVAKGKWTSEEDTSLLAAVQEVMQNGEIRWKDVSEKLATGRTDNMCRHRYDLLQKRLQKGSASVTPGSSVAQTPAPEDGGSSNSRTATHAPAHVSQEALSTSTAEGQQTVPIAPAAERIRPKPHPVARLRGQAVLENVGLESDPATSQSNGVEPRTAPRPRPRPRPRQTKNASADPPPQAASASVVSIDTPSGSAQSTSKGRQKEKATATTSHKDADNARKARARVRKRTSPAEVDSEQPSPTIKKRSSVTRRKARKKLDGDSETKTIESEDDDAMDVDTESPTTPSPKLKRPSKAPAAPT